MKIAHFADIHWRGLTRHKEYKSSFEDAFDKLKKLKPDIILIAGDIVHSKTQGISPELIDCLTWWFRSLAEIAETHVTLGNHDGLLMNEDREDAVSPILRAMQHPNIKLHKKSCNVKIGERHSLAVFSCFDEKNWPNIKPVDGLINIATYHGPVAGSLTDENWEVKGDVSVDFFNQFDFVMLGDIHKQQFLDKDGKIAYSGSTIQQNYGEDQQKGFLFWAIEGKNDFATRFVQVRNDFPFISLEYDGDVDSLVEKAKLFSETSRFRIKISELVSQGEILKIKSSLKNSLKPTEIVFKQEEIKIDFQDLKEDQISVDTFEDINSLVLDYYSGQKLSDRDKESLTGFLKSAWDSSNVEETNKSGKFHIKKMEFDNTFGYGEGNIINFDLASGITGIFGKNRSGKSSICGSLAYGLYNGTDRGSLKNSHVINTRKNFCNVKIQFSKNGSDYLLERQTHKVVSKKGEITSPTNLNLFQVDTEGNKRDLSEEQRRETEKILRDLVGNLDDFLLTSLSSQGHVNRFIDLSAASRKSNLAKFLKLDVFDQLNESLKEDLNLTKKMLESFSGIQFDSVISDLEKKILEKSEKRKLSESSLEDLRKQLESLQEILLVSSKESFTKKEIEEQKSILDSIIKKLDDLKLLEKTVDSKIEAFQEKIFDLKKDSEKYDLEDLNSKKKIIFENSKIISASEKKVDLKQAEIDQDEKVIKKLSEVPCQDKFPTCKYITDAVTASKNIESKTIVLKTLKNDLESLQKSHKQLLKDAVEEKIEEIKNINEKISVSQLEVGKLEVQKAKISGDIKDYSSKITLETQKLDKMKSNICDDSDADHRNDLLDKKKNIELEIKTLQKEVTSLSEEIGLSISDLKQSKKKKEDFESKSQKYNSLRLLSKALSKNGIPLNIIRKKLPQINRELGNILQPVSGFSVELESDESSSDMEIYINYGDSKRIIECGSGMEKMMSSIALRAALVNVSNLPKSDIFIIDEGFGALDGKNLESCSSLLRSLTKYFKSIIVISHVDGIKDMVDNIIEIDSKGRDSHVCFD